LNPKKVGLIDSVGAAEKGQARWHGPLGTQRKKIVFKGQNGGFLSILAENYV
jgi:hypothetical protein